MSPQEPTSRHPVSFSTIQFRWYEQIIGDQPCFPGPPLGLGWQYDESKVLSLDDYEKYRQAGKRRDMTEMKMPAGVRTARLREWGYSVKEINMASNASKQALKARMHSAHETEFQLNTLLALETFVRRTKFRLSDKSNRERIVWQSKPTTTVPPNKLHPVASFATEHTLLVDEEECFIQERLDI